MDPWGAFSEAWGLAAVKPRVLIPWALPFAATLLGIGLIAHFGGAPLTDWEAALVRLGIPAVLLFASLELLAVACASAVTVEFVRQSQREESEDLRGAMEVGVRRTLSLVALYIVKWVFLAAALVVPAVVTVLIFSRFIPLLVLGLIAVVGGWAILYVALSLAEAALVVEDAGVVEALGLAWSTSQGARWPLAWLWVLIGITYGLLYLLGRLPVVGPWIKVLGATLVSYGATAAPALAYLWLSDALVQKPTELPPSPSEPRRWTDEMDRGRLA